MAIAVSCATCGARMEYQDADAGRSGQCPTCQREIHVPLHLKVCGGCRRNIAAELTRCPACATELAASTAPSAAPAMPALVSSGEPATSGKAIASLVLGLLALVSTCVTGVPAIILGATALGDIRRSMGRLKGHGLAMAGIVTGALGSTLILVIVLCLGPALLLPAVQAAREAARRTQCRNNLKQIGLAMHNYNATWGSFPPPYIVDAGGRPLLSWRVLLLPYLDRADLYDQFHLNEPWDSPHNIELTHLMPDVFSCPSEELTMPYTTAYVAITGPGTAFPFDRTVKPADITDGLAATAMVGEVKGSNIIWSKPDDVIVQASFRGPGNFSSAHPGGWNMLFCDGAVRFISNSINAADCKAMTTIAGGETVQLPGY